VAQLVDDNRRLQSTINKLRDTTSSQTARLEEELASKSRSVDILQEKLGAQSDYDEVKRELRYVAQHLRYFRRKMCGNDVCEINAVNLDGSDACSERMWLTMLLTE